MHCQLPGGRSVYDNVLTSPMVFSLAGQQYFLYFSYSVWHFYQQFYSTIGESNFIATENNYLLYTY